jgi:hypothetical protein
MQKPVVMLRDVMNRWGLSLVETPGMSSSPMVVSGKYVIASGNGKVFARGIEDKVCHDYRKREREIVDMDRSQNSNPHGCIDNTCLLYVCGLRHESNRSVAVVEPIEECG